MRIRRICSEEDVFDKRVKELKGYLVERGHEARYVEKEINRARNIPREDTLKDKPPKNNPRIPFVLTYHPGLPNIREILGRLQPVLESSRRLTDAVGGVPMVAYRRPRCLRDFLVRAEIKTSFQLADHNVGCYKCKRANCMVCNFLVEGNRFRSFVTKRNYYINFNLNCNSSFAVYLISCSRCGVQYVGSTITKFRMRFNNHKSRINKHASLSMASRAKDDKIYQHFHSENHCGLEDVSVMLIDKCNTEHSLRGNEAQWAYRLNTISPKGLNVEEYVYL